MLDPQEAAQLLPQPRGKLAASVSDNGGRDSEPRNPTTKQSHSTALSSNGVQGEGLQPPGVTINHRKEVCLPLSSRQGTNKVQMKGRKTVVGDVEHGQWSLDVLDNLGALASRARSAEGLDLGGHALPNVTAPEIPQGSVASRVSKGVAVPKQLVSQGQGNHRSWPFRINGDIT